MSFLSPAQLRSTAHRHVTAALIALLLTVTVYVSAASDGYDVNEVKITATPSRSYITYDASTVICAALGGVLVPDATNPLHAAIKTVMAEYNSPTSFFTYLGGSTALSRNCPTSSASTNCVWYWDVGRYAGIDNAVPFYIGNFHAYLRGYGGLQGSKPIDIAMNYWLTNANNDAIFPGTAYGQYIMMVRTGTKFPSWIDSRTATYPYSSTVPITTDSFYVACLQVVAATTTTTSTTPVPTTTSTTTTTTTTSTTTTTTTTSTTAAPPPPPTSTTTTTPTPTTTTSTTTTSTTTAKPSTTTSTIKVPTTTSTVSPDGSKSASKSMSGGAWAGIGIAIAAAAIIAVAVVVCCAKQQHWWCFAAAAGAASSSPQDSRSSSQTRSTSATGSTKSTTSSLDSDEDTEDTSERSFSSGGSYSPKVSPSKSAGSETERAASMALATFEFPAMDTPSPASPQPGGGGGRGVRSMSSTAPTNAFMSTSNLSARSSRSASSAVSNSYVDDAFTPSVSPVPFAETALDSGSFARSLSRSSSMMRRMRRNPRVSFVD